MLQNLFAGLLGLLFQLLTSAASLKKDFKVANEEFVVSKFLKDEQFYIASSIVAILILSLVRDEVFAYKPEWEGFEMIIFVVVGALGSWALSYALGKTKTRIRNIVDEKTNELDELKKNNNVQSPSDN